MDPKALDQSPLYNFNHLEVFDLKLNGGRPADWDRFLEDFLIIRYLNFRETFQYNNVGGFVYFLNLLEGNFLVLKSDVINDLIANLKQRFLTYNPEYSTNKITITSIQYFEAEYIHIVNLGRIVIVSLLKVLFTLGIKLNKEMITKFMENDSKLDSKENIKIKNKIMSYNFIKSKITATNTNKIGKFILNLILDYQTITTEFFQKENEKCIIY